MSAHKGPKPMTLRTVRVPDDLWAAAQAKAAENEEYLSDVIRRALVRYTKQKG